MDNEKMYTGCGGSGWGDLFGAGFGGFLGAAIGSGGFFGNNNGNANAAAAVAAANQGTDSISRQVLAGQQEAQLQGAISGVNGRIDALGSQLQQQATVGQMQDGFTRIGAQLGNIGDNMNAFALGMKDCCCQMKTATLEQGYQNQLASERQTNAVQQGQAQLGYVVQQGFAGTTSKGLNTS